MPKRKKKTQGNNVNASPNQNHSNQNIVKEREFSPNKQSKRMDNNNNNNNGHNIINNSKKKTVNSNKGKENMDRNREKREKSKNLNKNMVNLDGMESNSDSQVLDSSKKRKSPEPSSSLVSSGLSHKKSNRDNHKKEFKSNSKQNGEETPQKEGNSKSIPYQFSHKDSQLFVEDRKGTPLKRLVLNKQAPKELLDVLKEKERKNKEEKEREEKERQELNNETGKLVEMNEIEESEMKNIEMKENTRKRANSFGTETEKGNLFSLFQASPLPPLDWVNPEPKSAPSTPLSSEKVDMKKVASVIDVEKIVEETQEAMESSNAGSRLSDIFSIINSIKSPKAPTAEFETKQKKESEKKAKLNADAPEFIPFGLVESVHSKKKSHSSNKRNGSAPLPPWCFGEFPNDLSDEIALFEAYISPSRQEKVLRLEVFQRVEDIVLGAWPEAQVHLFGSFASDLFLPYSDLDIVILECPPASIIMHRLGNLIKLSGMATSLTVLDNARVPIVKFSDKRTGINVDISFNMMGGLANTAIIKQFCAKIPLLKPLTLVIKYFLQQRGLNEPYTGGIGSYALVILVINFLQMYSINSQKQATVSTGKLLTDFFEFFGTKFNCWTTGISIRNGGGYFKKDDRGWFDEKRPFLLSIEDPQDETNDVSRNSFAMPVIRSTFSHAYTLLTVDTVDFACTPLGRILNVSKTEEMESHRRQFEVGSSTIQID